MGKDLPARAERFLYALCRELQSLSSNERDTVLLELRGHLSERAAQGEAALDAALLSLGDPADLATAFDQRQGAALAPVPAPFAVPWRRMRVREVLLEIRATLLASRDGLMMVGMVQISVLAALAFLWWPAVGLHGLSEESLVPLAVQIAAALLAYCAGYRVVLTDDRRPWRLASSTFRFAAAMIVVDSLSFAGTYAVGDLLRGLAAAAGATDGFAAMAKAIWITLGTVVYLCLTLRIQPWLVALAIERHGVTMASSWRGTSGQMLNILRGWIVLVLPLYILHLSLNAFALKVARDGAWALGLAVLDGIVSVGLALATILLNATIFRWAVGEPIPSPRPFATEPPDPVLVEECRMRLAMLMGSPQAQSHRIADR
jgi:hypothetical protein